MWQTTMDATHSRRRSLHIVALAVVVALPLLATSGVASAKVKAKGCHKTHTCKSGGGTPPGSGTSAGAAPMTLQIDPDPLVETAESDVLAVAQIETSPSFAGDTIHVGLSQLQSSCIDAYYFNFPVSNGPVVLDDDGNATVVLVGDNCAPGSSVIAADLTEAPYDTALATLTVNPPVVTTAGVFGFPTTSGTVTTGEVETGDSAASGDSDVYALFYVETDPVYAEQTVEISSGQLEDRCASWFLEDFDGSQASSGGSMTAATPLDDDGNAVFIFFGASCAAGPSEVIVDVKAGTHPTYTTSFNIVAPQPTI